MRYLLALIRLIGLVSGYLFFGIIGLCLFFMFYKSQEAYYRGIVFFTQLWAQYSCLLLNIRINRIDGLKVCPGSLIVANHMGAPDIFVMGFCFPAFFVSKSEVGRWPLMNWLAQLGATIFVDRSRKHQVRSTINQIELRLKAGCSVILFPEAQASDGKNILPFKSSHLEAAIQVGQPVVPVVIRYHDKNNPSIACWHNFNFLTHIARLLKCTQLNVTVEVLPLLQRESDRKILAWKCHKAISEKYLTSVDD